jgi:hypothetical protein
MAPNQRGEVGEIVVADFHAVQPDLVGGFLHVDGVPVHDGIECEAKGAKLLFVPLLERASDFAALAMVNAPAEAMTQFSVIELGQDASPERRIVNVAQNMDCFSDPAVDIFLAKYLCESRHFSNMFCSTSGGSA